MNRRTAIAALIVLAAVGVCLVLLRDGPDSSRSSDIPSAPRPRSPAAPGQRAGACRAGGPSAPGEAGSRSGSRSCVRPSRWLEEVEEGAPGTAVGGAPAAPVPESDARQDYPRGRSGDVREYLQDQIREVLPLLENCRQIAAQETPGLKGELRVKFTVEGAPGLVDSSPRARSPKGGCPPMPGYRSAFGRAFTPSSSNRPARASRLSSRTHSPSATKGWAW